MLNLFRSRERSCRPAFRRSRGERGSTGQRAGVIAGAMVDALVQLAGSITVAVAIAAFGSIELAKVVDMALESIGSRKAVVLLADKGKIAVEEVAGRCPAEETALAGNIAGRAILAGDLDTGSCNAGSGMAVDSDS